MSKYLAAVSVLALIAAPNAAFAGESCYRCVSTVVGSTATTYGSGYDDPNIPNCLVSPTASYAGGVCEQVQIWVNFGHDIYECKPVKHDD